MKNFKFSVIGIDIYFGHILSRIEVDDGVLSVNGERIGNIKGTEDQYELEEFNRITSEFGQRLDELEDENTYVRWFQRKPHHTPNKFYEDLEKDRSLIKRYLERFASKWT